MQLPPLGLYIHLPWCERKCPYCDFNSHEAADIPEQAYIDALLADLRNDLPLARGREVQTLFIGGGTPSLFSAAAIGRLLTGIGDLLPLAADLEATMEANPGSAEAEKFAGFRAAGINRLSLGIQSFDDRCLKALGRVHNSEQAEAAIAMARGAGFNRFNLDLMHGLPGQAPIDALADLRQAIDCAPPHLSWYQLTIEPNTVFYTRPPTLPVEDELAAIQLEGEQLLATAGYRQYEVSAYGRDGDQCRHNLNYWCFGDYLGIGAGAHGKATMADGKVMRYAKTRQPGDYLAANGSYRVGERAIPSADLVGEFTMNALRLNSGFSLALFEAHTGLAASALQPQLDALTDRDLLAVENGSVRATDLGRRFLDSVIAEFLIGS